MPTKREDVFHPEVTAPSLYKWRTAHAKVLLMGFVQSRSDGRLTVGCYVYDVDKGREMARKGSVIAPSEWRRAAHKCSGLAYTAVTGSPGIFDTRIAYVAESGVGDARTKRIAVMDSDGYSHRYVTAGDTTILTPRLAPNGSQLAYVSYAGGKPNVRLPELGSVQDRPLVAGDAIALRRGFRPTEAGSSSMMKPNCEFCRQLTRSGAAPDHLARVDTDPSFSPDGSKIVFESDRGGSQQLYVMNADGIAQRRISFGGGWYASRNGAPTAIDCVHPARAGRTPHRHNEGRRTGERLPTTGPGDEGPSWAPSSRDPLPARRRFRSLRPYRGRPRSAPRAMAVPQDGSDPDWSGVMD